MSLELRDYQQEALKAVLDEYKAGVTRQIIILPTGSGKTVLMAAIAKALNVRTLLIAHREELITQSVDKFKLFWPGVDIGVCMAERDEVGNHVVIGSVQSCSRHKRLERLKEQNFQLLLVDETHHIVADSYQKIIEELGFSGGSKLMVGVTATADRRGLAEVFDKIVFSRSISTMIAAEYLSPVVGRRILTGIDIGKLAISSGDFALQDLSEAVDTPARNAFIVQKFQEYAPDRKAVAFCVDVAHCKRLADMFKEVGIACEAVYGDMPSDERKSVLEGLKSGKIQVATSCGVLCEGFDEPSLSAVLMCRPTRSQNLYVQCVGRGLRRHMGKDNCIVLDFADNGHNLDSAMKLKDAIPGATVEGEEEPVESEEIDRRPKIHSPEACDKEIDLVGKSHFHWVDIGDEQWSLMDDDKREVVISHKGEGFVAEVYFKDGTSHTVVTNPIPLAYAQGVAEDYARKNLKVGFADLNADWMGKATPATSGQREFLQKNKAWQKGLSKGQASVMIREIIAKKNKQRRALVEAPITAKQRWLLQNYGVDTSSLNKLSAMKKIAELKAENNKAKR